jgi:hypothetical protein
MLAHTNAHRGVLDAVIRPEYLYHGFTVRMDSRDGFGCEWGGTMSGGKRDVALRVVYTSAEQVVLILRA